MIAPSPLFDDEALLKEEPTAPIWPPDGRTGEWWMFWQEDHPNTDLDALLREAMRHFQQKYHLLPNRALVHTKWGAMLVHGDGNPVDYLPQFPGLRIRTAHTMLMGHVGLSYEDGQNETH